MRTDISAPRSFARSSEGADSVRVGPSLVFAEIHIVFVNCDSATRRTSGAGSIAGSNFVVSSASGLRHHLAVHQPLYVSESASETMNRGLKGLMPGQPAAARDLRPRAADEDRRRRGGNGSPGSAVITRTKPQTKKPSLYRVLILNDDYTPMEFVV